MSDLRKCTKAGLSGDVNKILFPIEYKKLREGFRIPEKEGEVYALFTPEDVKRIPEQTIRIPLGFSCRLPVGYYAVLRPIKGINFEYGLFKPFGMEDVFSWEYNKDDDEWFITFRCYEPDEGMPEIVPAGAKVGYFELKEELVALKFVEVNSLEDNNETK